MTDSGLYADVFSFFAAIAALWLFLVFFYRDYRVDTFRQKIFALRDNLFDDAAAGLISFDHSAYGLLRGTMNGLVRFGHKLSIFEVILLFLFLGGPKGTRSDRMSFEKRLEDASQSLDEKTRNRINFYHRQMHKIILIHMIKSSPIFLLCVILPLILMVVPLIIYIVLKDTLLRMAYKAMKDPLGRIESAAMAYGQ